MGEPGVRDDTGVGPRDLAQLVEVAGEALPHLGDDDPRRRGRVAQRDRQAELVVVRLRVRVAAPGRERRREQILGRRLSRRPADRDHVQLRAIHAQRARDLLQRAQRVAHVHERASGPSGGAPAKSWSTSATRAPASNAAATKS